MTSDEVNQLPERVRRYIHDLETRCDPAGEVRQLWEARAQIAQLTQLVTELRASGEPRDETPTVPHKCRDER